MIFQFYIHYLLQMKQVSTNLVALQSAMWRLRPTMNDHPDQLQEVRDLAWEELHLRLQLRSHQIAIEVNEQVKNIEMNYIIGQNLKSGRKETFWTKMGTLGRVRSLTEQMCPSWKMASGADRRVWIRGICEPGMIRMPWVVDLGQLMAWQQA